MLTRIHNLTNEELIIALQDRSDLTTIEHELLDRLIRAIEIIKDLEADVPACGPAVPAEMAG